MPPQVRPYRWPEDFDAVSDFLIATYRPGGRYPNWLQPRWEYMHYHPITDLSIADRIGIWEDSGKIVAVANYEHKLGDAYFSVHPDYGRLKPELFDYAEQNLSRTMDNGRRYLRVHLNDFDTESIAVAKRKGYKMDTHMLEYRTVSQYEMNRPVPEPILPPGYRLKSLADDNDLVKTDRALWRGFDHPGEPPADGIEGRRLMQSTPHYRRDLNIVVEAPNGDFVSYSGIWYVAANRIGYVEPVATDPDYRRMGLGRAAVLECVRRCGELGATVVFVESAQPFYLGIGFEKVFTRPAWVKRFDQ